MEQKNYIEAKLAELDKALSEKKRIKALFPNQRARDKAMAYIDVETQDEVCLTMKTGEDITRGLPGTFALTLGVLFSFIAYHSNTGNTVEYLVFFVAFLLFFSLFLCYGIYFRPCLIRLYSIGVAKRYMPISRASCTTFGGTARELLRMKIN